MKKDWTETPTASYSPVKIRHKLSPNQESSHQRLPGAFKEKFKYSIYVTKSKKTGEAQLLMVGRLRKQIWLILD